MTASLVCTFPRMWLRFNMQSDLYHNTSDGGCTTATSQSMENENATYKTLILIVAGLASEEIVHNLRLEFSTQVVLILEAGMD